ncbi:MAG: hypothetical protein H2055_00700 [Sphingopyxis sp.]|nr:hypothetical protein [Sphingopyxis sp.]
MTTTGLVAAISDSIIVTGMGTSDRRRIIVVLMLLMFGSCILAAIATSVTVLLLARAMLGIGLGEFWGLTTAVALRIAPSAEVLPNRRKARRAVARESTGSGGRTRFGRHAPPWRSQPPSGRVSGPVAEPGGGARYVVYVVSVRTERTAPRVPKMATPGFSNTGFRNASTALFS